jgi:hypothetical protein
MRSARSLTLTAVAGRCSAHVRRTGIARGELRNSEVTPGPRQVLTTLSKQHPVDRSELASCNVGVGNCN